jgi:rhodanese-related sulfurtransferase
VRTQPELVFVGLPKAIDINIPFLKLDYEQWDEQSSSFKKVPNSQFISAFDKVIQSKNLTKNSSIVLLCRSGKRSAAAANLLTSAGYKKVYTVIDGFEGDKAKLGNEKGRRVVNGWKNAGLPWTYKLQQSHLGLSN